MDGPLSPGLVQGQTVSQSVFLSALSAGHKVHFPMTVPSPPSVHLYDLHGVIVNPFRRQGGGERPLHLPPTYKPFSRHLLKLKRIAGVV